jgi:hypothetical protein
MSNELSGRKLVLEQAIYQLNEVLDGASHPAVAKELRSLLERERQLLFKKEQKELERQQAGWAIAAWDKELAQIRSELTSRSQGQLTELLVALKQRRWYFFQNRPLWVFDRNTGFIWPNLDYVEFFTGKKANVVSQIKMHELEQWSVPTCQDLKTAWEDRTFPFFNDNNQVVCRKKNQEEYRFQSEEGFILANDFSYNTGDYDGYAIYPCNKKYETDEFFPGRHNRLFPDGLESERRLLQFMLAEDLMPFLESSYLQDIYHKFIRRRGLMKQYAKLLEEGKPKEKQHSLQEVISLQSRQDLCSNKELTVLEFYLKAHIWLEKVIVALEQFSVENHEALAALAKVLPQIETEEAADNSASGQMVNRLKRLSQASLSQLKANVEVISQEIQLLGDEFKMVVCPGASLDRLAAIENKPRPSLSLLVNFVCEQIQRQLQPLCWLLEHRNVVAALVKAHLFMVEIDIMILPAGRQKLVNQCADAGLNNEMAEGWVKLWQQEQEVIENKLLSLFDAVQAGVIPDSGAVLLLEKLEQYSAQIQRFYEEYRLKLQQKYALANNTAGEQQEEKEQLLKLTGPVIAAVKSLSFDVKIVATQNFLKQWSEPWLTQRRK